jgi:septum formation protein
VTGAQIIRSFILASGSPRRRQLLREAGLSFTIVESKVVETARAHEPAADFALRMAQEKALAVSAACLDEIVVGADTVVECEGRTLGKPGGAAEARAMLRMLSGRSHVVITGFAIARGGAIVESSQATSRVTFRSLTDAEIDDYVNGGEPLDKAGSYGIQSGGEKFISAVEGSRENVMGLPIREVLVALARYGIAPRGDR